VQDQTVNAAVNTAAAEAFGREANVFYGAPTVIYLSCDASTRWGRLDCGIATENICLAAEALGLGTVIVGCVEAAFTGPKGPELNALLKFPAGCSYAVAVAVGYPATTKEAHPVDDGKIDIIA